MDFFKGLGKKAVAISKIRGFRDYCPTGSQMGIDATIEALKEMMVRQPIKGKIWHCNEDDLEFTRFVDEEFDELIIAMDHIGANGEEVVVMVFKKP